jgi:prepilin-type N-terminal cleavage/methylation domain-containing protein
MRVRGEEGFTLVELLIAMMVLTVGILALVAAYSSGYVALNRATRVSSATLIADQQMERFRALSYGGIKLNTACGSSCTEDSTYTSDSTFNSAAQVTGTTSPCSTTPPDSTCLPTQTKTGPDGVAYRLDTYIEYSCVSGTLSTSPSVSCDSGVTPVKTVTVVVTGTGGSGAGSPDPVKVREQSTFTSITGQ